MIVCGVNHVQGSDAQRNCPVHGARSGLRRPSTLGMAPRGISARSDRVLAVTVASSNADDASFRALEDVASLTSHLEDVRIVGGHMVSLLLTAFPVQGAIQRRTADADAVISTTVASSGDVHAALSAAGYDATAGNHYERPMSRGADSVVAQIDLLVPSGTSRFQPEQHGGRAFDAAPGLSLALAADPIAIAVAVTLTDGTVRNFDVRVPPVEIAVVLKAYATETRQEEKDYLDLFNLLSIRHAHRDDTGRIGDWKMAGPTIGARKDAARILHGIADRADNIGVLDNADIPREHLVALIRDQIWDPR